jgi:hypothetical protein
MPSMDFATVDPARMPFGCVCFITLLIGFVVTRA